MQTCVQNAWLPAHLRIRWGRYQRAGFTGSHQACRLCDGTDLFVASRFDRWLNPLVNVMCRDCGLIFLDPMPTDAEANAYYKDQFWLRSQGSDEPTAKTILKAARHAEGRLTMLSPWLAPGMRILDVGAGGGEFLAAAHRRGFEVEGVEPSAGYAAYAQRKYGIAVHPTPLAEADLGAKKFDLITSNHSLEHMRDPLAALRRMYDLLQPKGHLYISVPNLGDERLSPKRFFHAGHCYGFTYETLVMMAAKAGFAAVERQPFGRGTTLIFRRLPEPDPAWFKFPVYAAQAERKWRRRTLLRYLLAPGTYARIAARIGRFLSVNVHLTRKWMAPSRPGGQNG
jgi:2-polyprenyl-3-methyl-5-hydroxy-6-metoxy-1,4-benzoquinol methylase